ncbi:MAG TPA: hypothetical protein VNU01_06905 [Egibacteraceae bacterium]|nr:hypothetical protein [Egibacteraceae bacterium]
MRPRTPLAIVLLLGLAVAGCASGDGTDTATETQTATPSPTSTATSGEVDEQALEAVAEAAQATVDEDTARFTLTVATEGTGTDGQAPVTAEGEEDFAEERRLFTFEGPQGELRIIVDGDTAYIEMPATEEERWAELELDRLSGGDFGFGGPGGIPFQGVQDNVEFLRDSAVRAEQAGEDDVDGEPAIRYELTVDLEESAEDAPEDTERGLRRTLRETGVRTLDVTVWVDEDGRVARIEYALDLGQADIDEEGVEADPRGRAIVTVDYRDFGADLSIDVPTGDEVVEMDEDELRQSFGGDSPTGTPEPDETET